MNLTTLKNQVWLFLLAGLLAIALTTISLPVQGQLINLPKSVSVPLNDVSQAGNLDIGKVKLDGQGLFSIAAPATAQSGNDNTLSPIERRVKSINYHLAKIVSDGFDPDSLSIDASILNNQTVLVASDKDWGPRYLLTVTPDDVELDEPSSIEGTAQKWATLIRQALIKAQWERQFTYQKNQFPLILALGMAMLTTSLGIRRLQKWRRTKRHRLEAYQETLLGSRADSTSMDDFSVELQETFEQRQQTHWYSRYLPRISLQSQIEGLLMLRPMLVAAQISLWFAGIGWMLHRFPQTRIVGDWLLRFPLVYVGISLGIWLSKPLMDSLCRLILIRVIDIFQEKRVSNPRLEPRALTIFSVAKQFNVYLILILGFIVFCYFIEALYFGLIILAGFAFLIQNVLQDFVKTLFILSEDQYALGDIIKIGDVSGTVERISLRNSQIRTMSGDLYIFSHSSFNQVVNFTHNQSGIKLAIDVAYSTDLDVAMGVIQEVARELQTDDHWSQYAILADLKGVDNFGENSITLCLVLKTNLGDQWTVAREYRRRLKAAFDYQGISIPFPQRSIWFENGLPLERRSPNISSP